MNENETIPCIKNKCLLFPVCKNKETIVCWDLKHYVNCNTVTDEFKMTFKNLSRITNTEKEIGLIFISRLDELERRKQGFYDR